MADFRETVQEHIGSMSPSELAATEARRRQREAGTGSRLVLEARWDPAQGSPGQAPVTKEVTIEVEQPSAPGGDGILRIFEGPAFKETLLLTPALYRLIAGGKTLDDAEEDRFFIGDGSGGPDKISVDRAALASILRDIHPAEMTRAARLIAAEAPGPVKSAESLQKLTDRFALNWAKDIIHAAVDERVAKVPSRTLHLIIGKDHVSLTVRKEELLVGDDGLFKSPLAAAIVQPKDPPARPAILIAGDAAAFRDRDAPFLKNTFGTGAVRRLVLDVVKLKDTVAGLAPEPREAALALLSKLIERAAALNREQPARPPVPLHPVMPVKRNRPAPPPVQPPAPVIMEEAISGDEAAIIAPDLDDVVSGSEDSLAVDGGENRTARVVSLDEDDGAIKGEPGGAEAGAGAFGVEADAGGIPGLATADLDAAAGVEDPSGPQEAGEMVASALVGADEESMAPLADDGPPGLETGVVDDIHTVLEDGPGASLLLDETMAASGPPLGETMDAPTFEPPEASETLAVTGEIEG